MVVRFGVIPVWLADHPPIPYEKGLAGHSDADVLIHVICDALLGAANLRDIGYHFPDSDPQYKNIDSKILLVEVVNLLQKKGFSIANIEIGNKP